MKDRIYKSSIALNVLVVVLSTVVYIFYDILRRILVLDNLNRRRRSFFDRFPVEEGDVDRVLDGDLSGFVEAYLLNPEAES